MTKSLIMRQLNEISNSKVASSSSLLRLQKTASSLDSRFADHPHTQIVPPLITATLLCVCPNMQGPSWLFCVCMAPLQTFYKYSCKYSKSFEGVLTQTSTFSAGAGSIASTCSYDVDLCAQPMRDRVIYSSMGLQAGSCLHTKQAARLRSSNAEQ